MTVLVQAESRDDAAAFDAIATVYRTPADRLRVTQLAVVLARHTGARVQTYGSASDESASPDVVVMSASDASAHARRLLDSGIAVVVVPGQSRAVARIARIGIGYDGGAPAGSALETAADTLRESEVACTTSREWARRLLAVSATDEGAEDLCLRDPTI